MSALLLGGVLFPEAGYTKLDLARYYIEVSEGALRAAGERPNVLVRYPDGIDQEFFYQKRAPRSRPDWIEVATLRFPSGRSAEEVVPRDAAALVDGQPERQGSHDRRRLLGAAHVRRARIGAPHVG